MRTPSDPESSGRAPTFPPSGSEKSAKGSSLIALQQAGSGSGPGSDNSPTVITPSRPVPPADPSLGLTAGSKLGHFELIGIAGTGGMAAVLKARDLELGRLVALKILPPHMARDPENVTRFKQEARAAAKLDHDNIARVFFCGEDRGLHFIAFEFVEGENLRTLIERRGTIPPAECVRDMISVAAGLAHAAERGVVHRDIKPSNIIITPDGKAKIVDMGLARNLAQSVNGGVTQSGVTLGTFDYISPEQALDPRRADVRSDIYSLGCAFYHALTGRAPVPEGTAAKKLYAHQHEPVVDPRVYNPNVPDELAAVLARMMAKDPAQRYQTPAELIAALSALARKLNLGTDSIPSLDGVTASDISAVRLLPEPPKLPVGLVVGLAALAVAAILLIAVSGPSHPAAAPPGFFDSGTARSGDTASVSPGVAPVPPATTTPEGPRIASSSEELATLLGDSRITEIRLRSGERYDLSRTRGISVTGRRLSLETTTGERPATIVLAAVPPRPTAPGETRPGSLTVARSEFVRFRGIRFELADGPPAEESFERPIGLLVLDVARCDLQECRFEADPGLQAADVAALSIVRSPGMDSTPATATLKNLFFGVRRGIGLLLAGKQKVEISESAFTPHPAAITVRTDPADPTETSAELTLRHATFALEKGSVIEAEDGARWQLNAGYCVFAAMPPTDGGAAAMMMTELDRKPAVVRVVGDRTEGVRFLGRAKEANAYFRVDPYSLGGKGYSFEDCRQRWQPNPMADEAAVELKAAPWAATDLPVEWSSADPWRGFALKTGLRQIRVPAPAVLLGARFSVDRGEKDRRSLYDPWPPAAQTAVAADPRVKVWWPNPPATERETLPRNVFEDLEAAVGALKSGDTLEIRADGPLPVPPVLFDKPNRQVTIRPYPGSHPILEPATGNRYETASLFRVVDEHLTLDGLEFRLQPRPPKPGDTRSLAVVTIAAGRECLFRKCLVTLDEQTEEKLSAVILTDPNGEMRAADGPGIRIRFEDTILRGKGRAVWAQSSRPFDLDIRNSITAIQGPVIAIDAPGKKAIEGSSVRVSLERMTAVLAGPLLELKPGRVGVAGKATGWAPVQVEAEACVFAPTDKGLPMVQIEGGDPSMLSSALTWQARRGNWYANIPTGGMFVDVTPSDPMATPVALDAGGWFAFAQEKADDSLVKLRFSNEPGRRLGTVVPADLEIKSVDAPKASPQPMVGDAGAMIGSIHPPADRK